MVAAPLPPDEFHRLQNLGSYQLLDTPYEAVFDEIASLAARICGVPYAAISLIDSNRQWLKAVHKLNNLTEIPRDISFCGHAILQDGIMHIPDAREDERFWDNPLVTGEPNIRTYAGMPLKSDEGYNLGALCVLSSQPVKLNEGQLESLRQLAHVLMTLFKARKKEARLAVLGNVLDQVTDEIILADAQTLQCTYANKAACLAFDCSEENIVGRKLPDMLRTELKNDGDAVTDILRSGNGKRVMLELTRRRQDAPPDDAEQVIELRLQRLSVGARNKIVAIGHDISERKKLEKVKADLAENLERHNRELSGAYGRLSEELAIAKEMQLRFLPAPKCINKVCFDWMFQSSSYLGGDIFDYFTLDDSRVCFYVIDVSGHGLSAALLAFNAQQQMFSARGEMLSLIQSFDGNIADVASQVVADFNRKFGAMKESSLYLTMIYGILDTVSGELALVQAGHPPPLLSEPGSSSLRSIGNGGLPIGILDQAEFESHTLRMRPGSRLYLYSDGIPDCPNPEEELFGQERMERLLEQTHDAPLAEVQSAVANALAGWHGKNRAFSDDITFLTVEYLKSDERGVAPSMAY